MKPTVLGARKSTSIGNRRSYDAASCGSARRGGAGGDSSDTDVLEFLLWVQFDYCGTSAADVGGVEPASHVTFPEFASTIPTTCRR